MEIFRTYSVQCCRAVTTDISISLFLFTSILASASRLCSSTQSWPSEAYPVTPTLKFMTDTPNSRAPLAFSELVPNPQAYDRMRPPQDGVPTKTFAADIFVSQTWKDPRLHLPENMTTAYRLLEVDWLEQIWRPDSFFKNAKQVTFQTMTIPNHYLWLYRDKSLLYMVKLTLTLSCSMNFALYPHDTQTCKLQMESLSHTTDDLIFEWDKTLPLAVGEIELPQLQVVENKTADCSQSYSTGNFTCLEVIFVLKRRLGYYLFHTYIPTCLIVVMSWISFWIAPEAAPARVTLGVTSLLTLSTQHAKSQAGLPPVSYLKAVDLFMSACTIFVFLALMEYCLVNIVLGDTFQDKKKEQDTGKRNSVIRSNSIASTKFPCNGAEGPFYPQCKVHPFDVDFISATLRSIPLPPPPPPPPPGHDKARDVAAAKRRIRALRIDTYSRAIFPLTFSLLNIIYWSLFMKYI